MPASLRRAGSWLRRAAAWMGLDERVCERIVRRPRRAYFPLGLERLEDRLAPASWTGLAGNGLWSSPGNWVNDAVPTSGDNFIFFETNLTTTSDGSTLNTSSTAYNTIDDLSNLQISGIIFDNGSEGVHTAGSSDPFALGGAAQAGTTGYTISGMTTISIALLGDNGSGIDVVNGVSSGTPNSLHETFGSGITINQDTATTFSTQDTGTQLAFNGPVTLNNFTLTTTGTFSSSDNIVPGGEGVAFNGVVSGAGGLDLNGFVALNGPNTYTDQTTMGDHSQAVVAVGNNSGLGNAGNTTMMGADGVGLNLDGVSVTQADLVFSGGSALYSNDPNLSTWNGPIAVGGGTATLASNGTGSRLAINGAISGAGPVAVGAVGASGVVEFEQANTYTGGTSVGAIFSGTIPETLQIDSPAGLGAGGSSNVTTVDAGSTLLLAYSSGALEDANGNFAQLSLVGAGVNSQGALQLLNGASAEIPGIVTLAGNTTVGVGTGVLTFDLPILQSTPSGVTIVENAGSGGAGRVVMDGGFTLGNSYTGTTTVDGGTLEVDTPLASPAINVVPGSGAAAALEGDGSVGAVTFTPGAGNQGATLAPVAGGLPAILNAGNVTLNAGSTFNVQINGPSAGSQYSQLDSTGTVTLTNTLLTVSLGAAPAGGTSYTIIDAASVVGTFSNGASIMVNGYTFQITYTSTTVVLKLLGPVDFWTGAAGDGLWSDAGNWVGGVVPVNGATVVFETNLTTAADGAILAGASAYNTIDNIPNLLLDGIVFDDGTTYSVHTAGSDDPFALGGAAQAGTTGYTISGTTTINLDSAAGVDVKSGVSNGTGDSLQEVFGSGITLNQQAASDLTDEDGGTVLAIDGNVTLNGFALSVSGVSSLSTDLPGQGVVLNGPVSQAGGLSLNGYVTLAGTNSYTGGTTIISAVLSRINVTNNAGLGSAANSVTMAANTSFGSLILDGVSVTQASLTINTGGNGLYGAGVNGSAGGTAVWNGAVVYNGNVAYIVNIGTGTTLKINGPISGGGGAVVVSSLTPNTPGLVEFEQSNTYTGPTSIGFGSTFPTTLQIDSPQGLGAGGSGNGTTVGAGSTLLLAYSGGALQDAGGNAEQLTLTGTGVNALGALQTLNGSTAVIPGAVTLGGATSIGVGTGDLFFFGPIGETTTSNLTIAEDTGSGGAGRVVFDAFNTYSGTTTVAGGTLEVDAPESGDFTVAPVSGATAALDGFGSVGGVTYSTVASGSQSATLAPGVGLTTGTLTATSVTLDQGSVFSDLLDLGSQSQLVCNGPLTISNATLNLNFGAVFDIGDTFTIAQVSSLSGFFSNAPADGSIITDGGLQIEIHYTNTAVTATILTNPTEHASSVDVTQAGQSVTLGLALTLPPGTTGVSGTATFLDAQGHILAQDVSVKFNLTTDQAVATFPTDALPLGVTDYTASAVFALTGSAYPAGVGGVINPVQPVQLTLSTADLLTPTDGIGPYQQSLVAGGGDGNYSYTYSESPADGLIVTPSGIVTGTPSVDGTPNLAPSGWGMCTITVVVSDTTLPGVANQFSFSLYIDPPIITVTTNGGTLSAAQEGVPYTSIPITATGGWPVPNYTFSIPAGELPPGMGIIAEMSNLNAFEIAGVATKAGTYPFTVTATDMSGGNGPYPSSPQMFTLTVNPTVITVGPSTLPSFQVGVPYNNGNGFQLTASGGNGDYTFSPPTGLPPGITLNSTTGVLSGTPHESGSYSFMVTANDTAHSNTTPTPYNVSVSAPSLALTPPGNANAPTQPVALPVATDNQAFNETISASRGAASQGYGSYSYVLAAVPGSSLPGWLSVNPNTGTLTGTPSSTGQVEFEVTATDSSTNQQGIPFTVSQYYSLNVNSAGVSLLPAGTTLPGAVVGVAYEQTITLEHGDAPITYSLQSGSNPLPSWLSLNPTTGALTGTPPDTGTFTFTIGGTDSSQPPLMAFNTYTLTVGVPNITISPGTLPAGQLDAAYSPQTFSASGGTGPYTFKVVGALPAGMSLSPAGVLSGTPLTAGPFSFSVQATDSSGGSGPYSASEAYTLNVAPLVPYEVAVIAGAGVWRHSSIGWQQLTGASATLAAVDARGDVAVEIPGFGVWRYEDATGWVQLTAADVTQLAVDARGDVAVEIPGFGVWRFEDSTGWARLTPADATQVSAGGNGIVAVELPGFGVWRYEDSTGWARLTPADASQVSVDARGDVAVDLPGFGVWRYEDSTLWQQLTPNDASQVSIAGAGVVAVEIPGAGVWRYEDSTNWEQLDRLNASQLAVDSRGDVLAQLLAGGLYLYQDGNGLNELSAADALFIGLAG